VRRRASDEAGVALVIAVVAMMLMAALGSALVLTTMTEAGVASNYAAGIETFYAADAALNRTLAELPDAGEWSALTGVRTEGTVVVSVAAGATSDTLVIRAQAAGSRDVRRTVEATVLRTGEPGVAGVRLLAWREVR
jgi:hypothetical protein